MLKFTIVLAALLAAFLALSSGQHYDAAYNPRGSRGRSRGGDGGGQMQAGVLGLVAGTFVGGWLQSRRGKKKFEKEKKDLVQYIKLQEEVYKTRESQWQAEYQKLYKVYDELEKETLERDYEEFKAPDTNNDDMISRAEFNTYVRKYLSSFPELSERDFPKFEEFDLDGDGIVSFEEWQNFLYQQKLLEAQKGNSGKSDSQANLLDQMYKQASSSDSFNSLQKNINAQSKGSRRA